MTLDHEEFRPDDHLERPCTCDAWWVQTQSRRRSEAPRELGGMNRDPKELAPPGSWFPLIRELARCIEEDPNGTADRTDAATFDLARQYLNEERRSLRVWDKWKADTDKE